MDRKPLAIAVSIVAAVILVFVVLLASGGGGGDTGGDDPAGDVRTSGGPRPPRDVEIADILEAGVSGDGEIELTARMAGQLPGSLEDGSLEWRWEILEEGRTTWILTATIDIEANASLVATQRDVSRTTIDGSLPGVIEVTDDAVTVLLETDELTDFPDEFEWQLVTSLDASRTQTRSARSTDRAPDEGSFGSSGD